MRWAAGLLAVACWAQPNPRVGFYQWATDSALGHSGDYLTQARKRVAAAGSGLLRFYVGPRYDYISPVLSPLRFPGLTERVPARIVEREPFHSALMDPAIPVVMLTVYPALDYGAGRDDINLFRPWGEREQQAEYGEMLELGEELLTRYGALDKTVILSNTEADSRMQEILTYTGSPELAIRNMIAWQNARFQAVDDARRRHPGTKLKLLNAFEIALVHLKFAREGGNFVKSAKGEFNALESVAPKVKFDLLSYSCYESINAPYETGNFDTPPEQTGPRLKRDLALLRQRVKTPVMVGELGLALDAFDKLRTGGALPRLASALKAIEEAQPAYVVFWQALDAPVVYGVPSRYGLLDPRRPVPDVLQRFIRSFR